MSSDEPTRPGSPDEAPQASETTDPTLQAEIEEKGAIDEPSGAEATPGSGDATERDEMPAPGAPAELGSDDSGTGAVTSSADDGADDGPATTSSDEPAPEGDSGPAAGDAAPASAGSGEAPATVPDQPDSAPAPDPAAGAAPEAAAAEKEETAAGEAEAEAKESPAEPEQEPAEIDELRQGLVDALRQHLGDGVVDHHIRPGVDAWVRISADSWRRAAEVARDHLDLRYFSFLSAIDWQPSPYGKSEDSGLGDEPGPDRPTEIEHGVTGGDTRFQVLARLHSVTRHVGLTFKADVPDDDPRIDSWSSVFMGADWHERETWEMFGITFTDHPNLIHLYLPGEFEGFPLRKDFPLLAREVKPWPGLVDVEAMPGEDPAPAEATAGGED